MTGLTLRTLPAGDAAEGDERDDPWACLGLWVTTFQLGSGLCLPRSSLEVLWVSQASALWPVAPRLWQCRLSAAPVRM